MPAGRPTEYDPSYPEIAAKLCKLGAKNVDLADFFGVSLTTIDNWKTAHPEFLGAINVAKAEADARVERSLYERATGYSYEAVKIFQYEGQPVEVPYREHVPPDSTAMIFWLKNRQPKKWRDKIEHTGADGGPVVISWLPPPVT